MAIDKISEFISHFIGVFSLTDTEDRLRDQSDAFHYQPNPTITFEGHDTITYLLRAPYEVIGHTPGVTPFWFSSLHQPGAPQQGGLIDVKTPIVHIQFDLPDLGHDPVRIKMDGPAELITYAPPPPPSIVVVTHQINILSDNDLMWSDPTAAFIPAAAFEAQLADLVAASHTLGSTNIGDPLIVGTDVGIFFTTISANFTALGQIDVEGASVTVLTGADTIGTTVNGLATEDAPVLSDVLPAYFQSDDVEIETGTDDTDSPVLDDPSSAEIAAELFDVADGHAIVAGGNLVINEAVLVSAPVDADVIAVMGDMVSLTVISQVNVVQDHDSGSFGSIAPTQVINAATIALESSDQEETQTEASEGLPAAWGVTRIEADVVLVNWMHQYNFVTDNDAAQITFSGEDTYMNFGGNTALNQVSLLEIAMGYDLIIIGGQMVNMALITQTNILLDDDSVTYSGDWPATISGGDNLLFNAATVNAVGVNNYTAMTDTFADAGASLGEGGTTLSASVAQDDLFLGNAFLSVLYIDGDMINITSVEQTNIVGDADQIDAQLAALEDRPDVPDGPMTVTTGSNAVVNIATILEYGMDSTIMVGGEVYDDVLLHQANLIDTDSDPLDTPIAPLANEAVAFLADDMIVAPSDADPTFITSTDDTGASSDVMGSVLA